MDHLLLHCSIAYELCLWCFVWQERNAKSFEGCEWSMLELKSFFFHTLLEWSLGLSHLSCFSLPVLLGHYNFGS